MWKTSKKGGNVKTKLNHYNKQFSAFSRQIYLEELYLKTINYVTYPIYLDKNILPM